MIPWRLIMDCRCNRRAKFSLALLLLDPVNYRRTMCMKQTSQKQITFRVRDSIFILTAREPTKSLNSLKDGCFNEERRLGREAVRPNKEEKHFEACKVLKKSIFGATKSEWGKACTMFFEKLSACSESIELEDN
jgi:hypothetical protein